MSLRMLLTLVVLGGVATLATWSQHAAADGGDVTDLVVGRIGGSSGTSVDSYGTVGGISAYAIGTTSCNNGNTLLSWRDTGATGDQHPVIAQNIYRIRDGRFEQIGMSWVKHGFCAADSTVCGSCDNEPGCDWLGPGCSDTYGATLNGSSTYLGPRFEVNAATGEFAWPHSSPRGNSTLAGRIQVDIDDVDPSLNAGAVYIGEGHYISPDDAANEWRYNNAAWRLMEVGAFSGGIWEMSMTGSTHDQEHAIDAWAQMDASVALTDFDVPGDGRFRLAAKVTELKNGNYLYDYAVFNMNSHRSADGFTVLVPSSATIFASGFHDVDYHSGEPYDNTDWSVAEGVASITWSSPETFDENPDTNALRWSTMYNFWFETDAPPNGESQGVADNARLDLFRPGSPDSLTDLVVGPAIPCPGDLDGDDDVDQSDLGILLAAYARDAGGDLDGDGDTDQSDLGILLASYGCNLP